MKIPVSKHRKRRYQGFTLIEIIIVVVILGILAAIALPKITANTDRVKASEAFNYLSSIGKAFNRCIDDQVVGVATGPAAAMADTCDSAAELENINLAPAGDFTYAITPNAGGIVAVTATLVGGAAADTITYSFNVNGTTTTACNGAGRFKGLCRN